MDNEPTPRQQVITALDQLIVENLNLLDREGRQHSYDPDQSEDIQNDARKRVQQLRKMREKFENLMYTYLDTI